MKKYVIILTTVLFSLTMGAQEAPEKYLYSLMAGAQQTPGKYLFTLEECLQYAMDRNYNRQSLKLAEESSQATYRQAKDERLPLVNASLNENFTHFTKNAVNDVTTGGLSTGGSYSINASIPIYQGGAIHHAIRQSRLQMEQSGCQTSQYENELTIQILQAFLSVLGNEELLKYQSAVMEASREQLLQGKEQYRFGSILESDYLLFEAQFASDRNHMADTEIARDNSLLTLKSLLSMNLAADLQIVYPDTAALIGMSLLPAQDEVTERALDYLPEMKISRYDVDIADIGIKLSKAGYYPVVSLGAGLGTGHSGFSTFGMQLNNHLNEQVGITVSIPIFNRNRTKSNVTRSKILLQQAELSQMQTELDIRRTVTQEYRDVVSAYNNYKVTDIRQEAYLKSFEACRAQFTAGAITPVELLQQQNNYISALNDYIQSKYRFMLKRKILDVYMGETVRFN